jgi:hypothetical protein
MMNHILGSRSLEMEMHKAFLKLKKFQPAMQLGQAVLTEMKLPVKFNLK